MQDALSDSDKLLDDLIRSALAVYEVPGAADALLCELLRRAQTGGQPLPADGTIEAAEKPLAPDALQCATSVTATP